MVLSIHTIGMILSLCVMLLASGIPVTAAGMTYYAATTGDDANPGSQTQPWKTIQHAADTLQPGDTVLIRGGIYRECVQPARGGTGEDARITYKAYPGETPIIKGSERIVKWTDQGQNVWKAEIPESLFNGYNPYTLNIEGPFVGYGQDNHLGDVYLDGKALNETPRKLALYDTPLTWFASHLNTTTAPGWPEPTTCIYANFNGSNPNEHQAEVLARECCFLPKVDGVKYLTLDGLTFMHAASCWVNHAGFQKGAVNTRMGYGWLVQNCHVADCKTAGICSGTTDIHHPDTEMEQIGHHIFRRNLIERCGESGFSGNLGYAACLLEANIIQDINYRGQFGGWESAGIKMHNAIDVTIKNNIIRRIHNADPQDNFCAPGIWLDWAAQGSRITGNIFSEIDDKAIYLEADHGPILVDNNVIIDNVVESDCERVVLAHNLFVNSGLRYQNYEDRPSQYWVPHTQMYAGQTVRKYTGDRYFNNIYITKGAEQSIPTDPKNPPDFKAGNNVFYHGAQQSLWETTSVVDAAFDPHFTRTDLPNGATISFTSTAAPADVKCPLINREFIGVYDVLKEGIEDHDGHGITIDSDLLGKARNITHPTAGPFETLQAGTKNTFTLTAGPLDTPITYSAPPPPREPEYAKVDEYTIRRIAALPSIEKVLPALQHTAAKVIRYGQPLARVQCAVAGKELAITVQVYDARITPGMKDWPDSSVDVMCSMPGSKTVRQVVFQPNGAGRGKISLHENGNLLADPSVRWTTTALPGNGYILSALIPLSVLKVDLTSGRFLFECAACAAPATGGPVQYRTLFHSVSGFMNNIRFGHMVIE